MTAVVGTVDTRILITTGDVEPVEFGTVTTEMRALLGRPGVALSTRRWRRDLAIAFLRMAWHTWTTGPQEPR